MASPAPQDDLTPAVFDAVQQMNTAQKAALLLNTSLAMIEAGQYGEKVERYLDVFLRTPCISDEDISRAQLARGNARRLAAERLFAQAYQDFQAVASLDPSNREARAQLRKDKLIHFMTEPACQRAPLEIWDRVARLIPRYHLRTWLFLSSSHREIAQRHIFRTLDLFFGDDQMDNVNKGLDLFQRVKKDPAFARKIKTLRIHWAYEEGDILDLMLRLFREALPFFTALNEFEWIGYPELRDADVQAVLESHPNLESLGLIGWHFDAEGVSAFRNLRKFTLRAEDDDGWADMGEVRNVLDNNESSLRHLCLGAYLKREHSWDRAFESVSIRNLTHLDLVDTRISHIVLSRIAHAHNLQSLTLHGTFEEPASASVVFGSDHVIAGEHTFLPHLEAFRFVLVGHDDDRDLFKNVTRFLRQRPKLKRLDLGSCPWDLVQGLLPGLGNLQVLRVRISNLNDVAIMKLVSSIPKHIVALHLSTVVSDRPIEGYVHVFSRFPSLGMLHLHNSRRRRPQISVMSEKEFQVQTDLWFDSVRCIAAEVPSLDFIGWHGEHFVIVRGKSGIDLKELPARRRLDCGTGVDLGSDDAAWMERKDVPIDYEMSGLEHPDR
ncbi:uncharacterized protein FOMMEDRAFT_82069 [Fomitiporia mediterranea MF3/22]|uniref:uncharacterized protein n=1 Tax=Fomitiporia mediterranea (strain MF3/22) TaxID=694068 RepID=UPI000440874D|nr:uncharacterized protein FOMMEDRAFT_82069 [Fomitiporia mediterranea MF3/22]EJD04432.1 hypothetical protein FOMMEDRAFT_82069 [Fomitiporia mediterranea MF3/22]